jgi:putative ABC transport system permease protein
MGKELTPFQPPPAWRRYLRFWGSDPARDLDDELRFHFDALVETGLAAGHSMDDAQSAAIQRFGDLEHVRARCATIDSQWQREQTLMDTMHRMRDDLRHAVRALARDTSLTVAAILCFALGIGANTAIFSIVNGVLFRPLPFRDANRLVLVGEWLPAVGGENFGVISAAEFTDYQRLAPRVFSSVAVYDDMSGPRGVALSGDGEPERVSALDISPSLLATLGVSPERGRAFGVTDDSTGGVDAIILSNALWKRRFGGKDLVGRTINVDGRPRTIVGIMPPSFVFPLPGIGRDPADVYLPLRITPRIERERGNSYEAYLVARLAPGVTLAQAKRAVAELAASYPTLHPDVYRGGWKTVADAFPFRDRAVRDIRKPLLILLGAVALVLLIACINVSSLMLARMAARHREIAVRQALGASRLRLVQQFLAESLVLATVGAVLGLVLAIWGTRFIASNTPGAVLQGYDPSLDFRVLGVLAGIVIVTAIAFSVVPALSQSTSRIGDALRDEARGATAGGGRVRGRRALVVAQIAIALTLAAGAGLMTRSFLRARDVRPGFDPAHLVSFRVGIPDARYASAASVSSFDQRVVDRLRGIPGVANAAASLRLPLEQPMRMMFSVEHRSGEPSPVGTGTFVTPGYFATMRIPILSGRAIDASDADCTVLEGGRENPRLPVVTVNEALAKHFYGQNGVRDAVGKRVKWGPAQSGSPWLTIVGVVGNVKDAGLDRDQEFTIYFPLLQAPAVNLTGMLRSMSFVVRTNAGDGIVMSELTKAVRAIDPEMPVVGPRAMTSLLDASLGDRRFNTYLLGAFALLALVLAAVGIYGLIAYMVVQRSREMGVRLALGALPRDVVRMIVGQAIHLALLGIAIGVAGALAMTRVIRTLLFDTSPFDPATFAIAAAILAGVAALASLVPAWRASRTDPQIAMRAD